MWYVVVGAAILIALVAFVSLVGVAWYWTVREEAKAMRHTDRYWE
jgi:hypothetical protein